MPSRSALHWQGAAAATTVHAPGSRCASSASTWLRIEAPKVPPAALHQRQHAILPLDLDLDGLHLQLRAAVKAPLQQHKQ
jgi:hypothetical protein